MHMSDVHMSEMVMCLLCLRECARVWSSDVSACVCGDVHVCGLVVYLLMCTCVVWWRDCS